MAYTCQHALLAQLQVALCTPTHIHLNFHSCLAQIVVAVMYFSRWHVSSEFLSVAIAAQVTICVQIDQAPHLGPNATVTPPRARCPNIVGTACTAAPVHPSCSMRCRWLHLRCGTLTLCCAAFLPGAAAVLAHPVLGAGLSAAEQQVRLDMCMSRLHSLLPMHLEMHSLGVMAGTTQAWSSIKRAISACIIIKT